MQVNNADYISFGKNKTRNSRYTTAEKKLMQDIRRAALTQGWHDIYTDEPFSPNNPPSIDHLVPFVRKQRHEIKKLNGQKFQINGLENLFPAGIVGNRVRSDKSILRTILDAPEILKRFLDELEKYKLYKSDLVDGKTWAEMLHATLLNNIEGLCSNVRTRKMYIYRSFTKAKHL